MKGFNNSHHFAIGGLLIFLCAFVPRVDAEEIAFYVSPEGNDSWSGDGMARPFASIGKARDVIRALKKKDGLTQPVTVYLRGGLYELEETIVFTLEDSGTRACPITYTAYEDEEPVVSGGRGITGPWRDYQGEIKVCTIPAVRDGTRMK